MQSEPYTAEELSRIDAIHAAPRDDAPRLAYADWLEAHGAGDYAEFIRLQCKRPYIAIRTREGPAASLSHDFPDDEAGLHRLKRLISLWPVIIQSERFAPYRQPYHHQEFVRGLALWEVDEVALSLDTAGKNPLVTDPPPLVRFRFCLRTEPGDLAAWLSRPIMRRVDVLRLKVDPVPEESDFDPAPDLSLVDFSFFRGLEEINLGQVPAGVSGQFEKRARAARVWITHEY